MTDRVPRLACVHPGCPAATPGIVIVEAHDGQPRCLTHALDPVRVRRREERNLAGGANRRRAIRGEKIPWLSFETRQRVKAFARELAHQVLTGQLDPRLSAEARGCATLALQCDELELLERLDGLEMKVFGRRLVS